MIHVWHPSKLSNFQDPSLPLVHLRLIFFHPLDFGRPISNEPSSSSLQMITNQLKENIIQGWLSYVVRPFLEVGFGFQYQLINLVWLSFEFFSFSWSLTIYSFLAFYSCVCSCPKISRNIFYLWLFTFLLLILQSDLFYLHNLIT